MTQPSLNRRFHLAAVPVGMPKESDFQMREEPVRPLRDGEALIQSQYWSVDPYMRGRITGIRTYADPVLVGDLMVGRAVGQVLESNNSAFQPGDIVKGEWGWQEFPILHSSRLSKVDPALGPVSTAVGILGPPGATAYFGMLELCRPKPGDTVVVSGAAGAVGSCAGQIAKLAGCRVIGTAGTDDKIDYLTKELGFDAAFNYKTTPDYSAKLKEFCPQGIDCYFDNVGGSFTDAVFPQMNLFGRVAVCGQISQYNLERPELGPRLFSLILTKQLRVEGFIVSRFVTRFPEAIQRLSQWIKEGKLKYREEIVHGFENLPKAFIEMLNGRNTGKMVVQA